MTQGEEVSQGEQSDLDPQRVCRQPTEAGTPLLNTLLPPCGIALLCLGLVLPDRPFELLEPKLQLILIELLGLAAELQTLELQ